MIGGLLVACDLFLCNFGYDFEVGVNFWQGLEFCQKNFYGKLKIKICQVLAASVQTLLKVINTRSDSLLKLA